MDFALFTYLKAGQMGQRFPVLKKLKLGTLRILAQFDQTWFQNVYQNQITCWFNKNVVAVIFYVVHCAAWCINKVLKIFFYENNRVTQLWSERIINISTTRRPKQFSLCAINSFKVCAKSMVFWDNLRTMYIVFNWKCKSIKC